MLLGKALVADPAHRPDDLAALANAMHHLAPMKSIPPPDADVTGSITANGQPVDIRMSLLPPDDVQFSVVTAAAVRARMPASADGRGNRMAARRRRRQRPRRARRATRRASSRTSRRASRPTRARATS